MNALRDRWYELWERLEAEGDREARFADLCDRYSEAGRTYHTLAHIASCLAAFDAARHLGRRPDEVEYAIWFHDAVYDPQRLDNEDRSAALASKVAAEIGMNPSSAKRVGEHILATKHESIPSDVDAQVVVDCDLVGLGLPFDDFRRNSGLVRQECAWQDDAAFKRDVTALFRRFLDRPGIYCTEFFRSRYETQARHNLEQALASL